MKNPESDLLDKWPEYLSREMVARYVDISLRTLDRLRQEVDFPKPSMLGRLPRWRRSDIENYLHP